MHENVILLILRVVIFKDISKVIIALPTNNKIQEVFEKTITDGFSCVEVAREVKLKLIFTDYFFHNLVILIKLCKIRYLN